MSSSHNTFAAHCYDIFETSTLDYHKTDHVDAVSPNPYDDASAIEHTLYA